MTSVIQKHARSPHSSVSAILGGGPNPIQLGSLSSVPKARGKSPLSASGFDQSGVEISAVAKHRWGLRGQKGKSMQDNPMVAGFAKLRHEIAAIRDIRSYDAPSLLAPFLHVIQAEGTATPITILALGALRKFLSYGFICSESPRFAIALQSLSAAVTHCQFDISDSSQGEVVLLMVLNLMEDMMSGPGGHILSDESVCDMMGRGLAVCSQPRFSPVLRRTAEASMVRMCQIIFEDLKHINTTACEEKYDDQGTRNTQKLKVDQVALLPSSISIDNPSPAVNVTDVTTQCLSPTNTEEDTEHNPLRPEPDSEAESDQSSGSEFMDLKPYSLLSVRELFRVLVNFLDPNDRRYTDTMRVMALRILHVALEVSGPYIARHPALAMIAEDRLCCYLFQLVRSDNMAVLQESLTVTGTLLATCREILKLQQELFLSYLIACLHPTVHIPHEPAIDPSLYSGIPETPKLVKVTPSQHGSGRSTPIPVKERQKLGLEGDTRNPEIRQAMVESIGVLARIPTFMTELFVNYDCDENRADLCEDTVGLLSRNALPDSATWSTTSVPPLCLDALLQYIGFIAQRVHDAPVLEEYTDPAELRERRRRKTIIIQGVSEFNEKPKTGLRFLETHGIIKDVGDPVEVAKFLKGSSRVSKMALGDFLSKRGNEAILKAFMDTFDFAGKRLDDALRILLETFRLPGEAPLIASIVESFSEKYFSSSTLDEVANKDAVFILTYAIIILNTDQHNPNLKFSKRMTFDDFSRNLRGQNNGQDFSTRYLKDIYDSIRSNEIILPDEHVNKHAFDYAWRDLMLKAESAGRLVVCDTNIYDADIFALTWKPIVSTLSYVFMSATDDAVFARIVTGFDECAQVASKYGNTEAFDQIIYCLGHMSTLSTEVPYSTTLNTEVQVGSGSVMVSEVAVKLGRDFRAQLAMLVLFRVITGNEGLVRQGWKSILQIWRNLFINSLLTSFASASHCSLAISSIPLQTPSQIVDRVSRPMEPSLFSTFTSYISSYAADDPPEPSEEELESTLCTVDCVKSCNMNNIFSNIATLPIESTLGLLEALLDQIPENDDTVVMSVKNGSVPSPSTKNQNSEATLPRYDPSITFILEFATIRATQDSASVESMGKRVYNALQAVLRNFVRWHPIIISRATYYSLIVLKHGYDHDFVNVPFLLHAISSLPKSLLVKTSEIILSGIASCTEHPGSLRSEMMTSPDFWAIMRILATSQESVGSVFHILEEGNSGSPPAIMAENYEAAVSLLDYFATSANPSANGVQGSKEDQHQSSKETKPNSHSVLRACRAIEVLQNMTSRIPQLMHQSHLEFTEAWAAYWLPIFQSLTTQCTNPVREVRHLAFSATQRLLLSPELTCADGKEWATIFDKVLFPLILRLLKPEVFSVDRDGMSEIRVQSASLLCKVFLQYLVLSSEGPSMLRLWIRIIENMNRLMNTGQGGSLEEAVRENLKNVVLYMASTGCLTSFTQDVQKRDLWDETWKRLDKILPDLKNDLADKPDMTNPPTVECLGEN